MTMLLVGFYHFSWEKWVPFLPTNLRQTIFQSDILLCWNILHIVQGYGLVMEYSQFDYYTNFQYAHTQKLLTFSLSYI